MRGGGVAFPLTAVWLGGKVLALPVTVTGVRSATIAGKGRPGGRQDKCRHNDTCQYALLFHELPPQSDKWGYDRIFGRPQADPAAAGTIFPGRLTVQDD
jgi:hypothetical protein